MWEALRENDVLFVVIAVIVITTMIWLGFLWLMKMVDREEGFRLVERKANEAYCAHLSKRLATCEYHTERGKILGDGRLTADMILDRFEELYEYLGIERKELPKQDRTHKLVKKQQKGK